jgi:hypothetical protein
VYNAQELEECLVPASTVEIAETETDETNLDWTTQALNSDIGPNELLSKYRSALPTVVARYNLLARDRSAALWALSMNLFRVGLTREQVFFIAYHSPNNKFKELRFGGIKELAKDVLRAELATKRQIPDIKEKIKEARKLLDNANERSDYLAKCIKEHLEKLGSFVHCVDDSAWYIREDIGRPIKISSRSENLLNMLDSMFGINPAEKESSYVNHRLVSSIAEQPVAGKVCTLSHYDNDLKIFTLHTGRKDVLVVSRDGITRQVNGYGGLIFPWNVSNTAISPHYRMLDSTWDEELFGDCLNNVLNIDKSYAQALLKVWFLTVLLRDGLGTRPILALFGMPGSGKSTLFRRIYTLLYGRGRGLNTVTKEEDFDQSMAKDPLVVLDNVDTYARWLPDRLAATVSPTEIQRRKLYTDGDTYTMTRSAMLGITAHNPKFGREDVTDRLILLTFERLAHFKPENQIFDRLVQMRNVLWGAILQDIQTVLQTDMPRSGYPQFRIEDFAQYGYWIATALGVSQEFSRGLQAVQKEQRSFNLEEDLILINALDNLLKHETIEEQPAGALWTKLRRRSGDERIFDRKYSNAVSLGRKLWTLIDSLREIYSVEYQIKRNMRVWTISRLDQEQEIYGTRAGSTATA